MAAYASRYLGLTIVITPKQITKDNQGQTKNDPGKSIRFRSGRYVTKDHEEEVFLREYAKRRPGVVVEMTEADKDLVQKVREIVKKTKGGKADEAKLVQAVKDSESKKEKPKASEKK